VICLTIHFYCAADDGQIIARIFALSVPSKVTHFTVGLRIFTKQIPNTRVTRLQSTYCKIMEAVTERDDRSGVASYGALGHVPPRLLTILFSVHFGVNLRANYPSIV